MTNPDARTSIVEYLRHVSQVEVGTLLSPTGRELVEMVAQWIENELDVAWATERDKRRSEGS